MKVEIDFSKSLEENASDYYALSKKSKKKLEGLKKGSEELERKIKEGASAKKPERKLVRKKERKWYEKFHWFFTSEGFLVISGRDAKSNEVIVKKMMEKKDVYFHADVHGAPHTVLKTEGKKPGADSLKEAAIFAAVFSKAWASQVAAVDVYSADPSQISKRAPSGESIGTGAFMVYGKREWFKKTPLEFAVGIKKDSGEIFSGPIASVKKSADFSMQISFGSDSKGASAKKIASYFSSKSGLKVDSEEIVPLLPTGGLKVL